MISPVCVDASFVVKILVPEQHSDRADALWAGWLETGIQIVAPSLLAFEVPSVIRKKVQRGLISAERGRQALDAFVALSEYVELIAPDLLHLAAWELASQHNQPNLYDSYYIALAQSLECRLYSADDHLCRTMPDARQLIVSLSEHTP
jgi:predicted nucleic acid-binding protein